LMKYVFPLIYGAMLCAGCGPPHDARYWIRKLGHEYTRPRPHATVWTPSTFDSDIKGPIQALHGIGPAAVPACMAVLRAGGEEDEVGAIGALGLYGQDSRDAVPLLVQELDKQSHYAAVTLGRIGPAARAAIPELSKRLENKGQRPEFDAALAIAKIDPGNK